MRKEIQPSGFLNMFDSEQTYFCSNLLYFGMQLEHLTSYVYKNCLHKPGVLKPWHNFSAKQSILLFYNIFNAINVINFIVKVFKKRIASLFSVLSTLVPILLTTSICYVCECR